MRVASLRNTLIRLMVVTVVLVIAMLLSSVGVFASLDNAEREINHDDIVVLVFIDRNMISIEWDTIARRNQDYIVRVFAAGSAAPFLNVEASGEFPYVDAELDPAVRSFRVDLAYASDPQTPIRSKTVSLDTGVAIALATEEVTSASQATVTYSVSRDIIAGVSVDGRHGMVSLSGSGSFSIELSDGYNMVSFHYRLDDPNVIFFINFEIVSATMPPMLLLPEHRTPINVAANEFTLAGVTELGVEVSVDGVPVDVSQSGAFVHTVVLNDGENIFRVSATDYAGNVTQQDVIIIKVDSLAASREEGGGSIFFGIVNEWLPLIASIIGSIVLLIVALIIRRGIRGSPAKAVYAVKAIRSIAIALSAICAAVFGYSLFRFLTLRNFSEGEGFFALARESIDRAYELLRDIELYETLARFFGVAALVGVLVIVATALVLGRMKKPKEIKAASGPIADANDAAKTQGGVVCPYCGAQHGSFAKFCRKCGAKL